MGCQNMGKGAAALIPTRTQAVLPQESPHSGSRSSGWATEREGPRPCRRQGRVHQQTLPDRSPNDRSYQVRTELKPRIVASRTILSRITLICCSCNVLASSHQSGFHKWETTTKFSLELKRKLE